MNIEWLNLINYNVCWFFNYVGEKNRGVWCFVFWPRVWSPKKIILTTLLGESHAFWCFGHGFFVFFFFFQRRVLLDCFYHADAAWSLAAFGTFVLVYFIFIFYFVSFNVTLCISFSPSLAWCFSLSYHKIIIKKKIERERVHISQARASINIIFIFAPLNCRHQPRLLVRVLLHY